MAGTLDGKRIAFVVAPEGIEHARERGLSR